MRGSTPSYSEILTRMKGRCGACGREKKTKGPHHHDETWACGKCLATGKAVAGDPSRQNFGGFGPGPYLAYWDELRTCQHCGDEFVFSGAEKRFWYEDRGFITHSEPTGCPGCRRTLRRRHLAQRRIAERLPKLDPKNWTQLAELSDLCWRAGSKRKALEYLRRAKNVCSEPAARRRLLKQLELVESCEVELKPGGQFRTVLAVRADLAWYRKRPDWVKWAVGRARPFLSKRGLEVLESVVEEYHASFGS